MKPKPGGLIQQWCTGCGAQMHEGEPLHKAADPGHTAYVPSRAPVREAMPPTADRLAGPILGPIPELHVGDALVIEGQRFVIERDPPGDWYLGAGGTEDV